MTKTKYLLYAFKYQQDKKYTYWYETDNKFFQSTKPLKSILDKNPRKIDNLNSEDIIEIKSRKDGEIINSQLENCAVAVETLLKKLSK